MRQYHWIALIAGIFTAVGAHAAWEWAGTFEKSQYFFDRNTGTINGNTFSLWEMQDYYVPDSGGSLSMAALNEYDCNRRQFRYTRLVSYTGHMVRGQITSDSTKIGPWTTPIQGGIQWNFLRKQCD